MTTFVCAAIDTTTQQCTSWAANYGLLDALALTPSQMQLVITSVAGYWGICYIMKSLRSSVK